MNQAKQTIVLIHGLWMTPRSWDLFREFYEGRGYQVFAPAWSRLNGEVEDIRHLVPAVQNRINYKEYAHSRAITDYKEFPDRSHWIIGQEGWQEVAEYALA